MMASIFMLAPSFSTGRKLQASCRFDRPGNRRSPVCPARTVCTVHASLAHTDTAWKSGIEALPAGSSLVTLSPGTGPATPFGIPRTQQAIVLRVGPSRLARHSRVARALNRLRDVVLDAARGYAEAARDVRDETLAAWLQERTNERGLLARELAQEVEHLDAYPSGGDTFLACMHRGWMRMRTLWNARASDTTLAECLRGEAAMRRACDRAIARIRDIGTGSERALIRRTDESAERACTAIAARRQAPPTHS
jgi:uncharacterized protein (TIGR02284 family)